MLSGAKKRKALKKKKQHEAIGTSTNDNLHGNGEHGSQEESESDSSLSSPGSQGNEKFETKGQSSGMVKGAAKEISEDSDVTQGIGPKSDNAIAVETGVDYQNNIVEILAKHVAFQDAYGNSITDIAPAVDSVSKVLISEKIENVATSTHLVKQKSDENEDHPSPGLEKDNHKVVTLPRFAAETSKKVEY